ncbi:hypothetical protein bwei_0453 [Bacillus mycoides]|nr:hypothetical protein bwei_0453 [Bacillus mycoides]EEL03006.1 hypothetical protein bcere0014_54450 [Bacillus cereus BDRD-ST196]
MKRAAETVCLQVNNEFKQKHSLGDAFVMIGQLFYFKGG